MSSKMRMSSQVDTEGVSGCRKRAELEARLNIWEAVCTAPTPLSKDTSLPLVFMLLNLLARAQG